MKVLVVSANRVSLPFPVMPVGACMVAEAAERAGHEVRFLDMMFEKGPARALVNALKAFGPDVVGLSVRNIDNNDMQEPAMPLKDIPHLVKTIRGHSGAPVVLGGAAVAVMPEEVLRFSGADCAVVGEGEEVFPLVVERLSGRKRLEDVPGAAWIDEQGVFRANPGQSAGAGPCPDHCPAPDFPRWTQAGRYLRAGATVPLQTKIGCQFSCVYCTYRKVEGAGYRLFAPESAATAAERYASQGLLDVEFVDSVFNSPYGHAMEVCEAVGRAFERSRKRRPRLHTIELNPLFVDDGLLRAMEYAGFAAVGITAESASDRVLAGLGKNFSAGHVMRAAEVVKRHNIPCLWIFMLGGPGETEETALQTIAFARRHIRPSDAVFFNIGVRIYPGTGLENTARAQGLLSLPAGDMLEPVFYVSPEVDICRLIGLVKRAMGENLNFINTGSIGHRFLPAIHRLMRGLGLGPPTWRHTRLIRKALRLAGMDV